MAAFAAISPFAFSEEMQFSVDFGDFRTDVDLLRNHGLLPFTFTMALAE